MLEQYNLDQLVKMTMPQLQRYTWKILNNDKQYNVEADEIINTAYLILWERGLEFNFTNMRKPIFEAISQFKFNKVPDIITLITTPSTDKCCKRCKDVFPVAMFYVSRRYSNGLVTYSPNCKKCKRIVDDMNRAKRLEDTRLKQLFLDANKASKEKRKSIIATNERLTEHFKSKAREYQQRAYYKKKELATS